MSMTIHVEKAERDLASILKQLKLGESATLVDADGSPVAVLVSLKAEPAEKKLSTSEWIAQMEDLAQRIGKAWKGDKGAVETLSEMRR